MKQIYTKTGDEGTTSLRGGQRVAKDDIRIETNGQIDHLNSLLGIVCNLNTSGKELIGMVQKEMMTIMSHIATPQGDENPRQLHTKEITQQLEQAIDSLMNGKNTGFVVPGNNMETAMIHVARTQTRTIERRLWTLNRQYPVEQYTLKMFNRLSDFLFALTINQQ